MGPPARILTQDCPRVKLIRLRAAINASSYVAIVKRLFLHSALVASVPFVGEDSWNLRPLHCYVGRMVNDGQNGEYWNGNIDNVRIHNKALSATQMAALVKKALN